jgi:hypothetical protein
LMQLWSRLNTARTGQRRLIGQGKLSMKYDGRYPTSEPALERVSVEKRLTESRREMVWTRCCGA